MACARIFFAPALINLAFARSAFFYVAPTFGALASNPFPSLRIVTAHICLSMWTVVTGAAELFRAAESNDHAPAFDTCARSRARDRSASLCVRHEPLLLESRHY